MLAFRVDIKTGVNKQTLIFNKANKKQVTRKLFNHRTSKTMDC